MTAIPPHGAGAALHPALSPRQGMAMLQETSSVRNLLRSTVDAIRQMRYLDADADPVFTLGSIGVEKALKAILGCKNVEDTGHWPSKELLQDWATTSRRALNNMRSEVGGIAWRAGGAPSRPSCGIEISTLGCDERGCSACLRPW